jgi:flagellar basal-body rod protein FlgB
METSNSGLMGLLTQKMSYLNQRQSVLAENVANSTTPGYVARDLAPFTFDDAMKQASVGMAVTDPRHIIPASMSGVNSKTEKVKGAEMLPSGNSVDVESQMMAVSKNSVDYQAMTSIYKKMIGLFKIAIKGSST